MFVSWNKLTSRLLLQDELLDHVMLQWVSSGFQGSGRSAAANCSRDSHQMQNGHCSLETSKRPGGEMKAFRPGMDPPWTLNLLGVL